MSKFREVFPSGKVFLPVIHCGTPFQTVRNVEIAIKAGADGVFLIDHTHSTSRLHAIYEIVREMFPELWIGLNFLGEYVANTFGLLEPGVNGLWADDQFIRESAARQEEAEMISRAKQAGAPEVLFFGSVAFKYQPVVGDIAKVARLAQPYVDVLTTSGPGTGVAAEQSKVMTIREAVGDDFPVALASGVTSTNVAKYLPFVDCFLVSTGISISFNELNPEKTAELAQIIHAYS